MTWVFVAGMYFLLLVIGATARVLIGVANSKTGVYLKDTGARDEHGMQPLDDIFSSPDKDSRNGADESEDESDEEPMDIDEGKPDRKHTCAVCDETSPDAMQ